MNSRDRNVSISAENLEVKTSLTDNARAIPEISEFTQAPKSEAPLITLASNNVNKEDSKNYSAFAKALNVNNKLSQYETVIDHFYATFPAPSSDTNKPMRALSDCLNDNIVIGETHTQTSAKNFLINNMRLLKDAGYTTLYLEGLSYEQQADLDAYSPDDNYTHHANLANSRLNLLNEENNLEDDANNYKALVNAAKEVGIRVVGVDTNFSITNVSSSYFKTPQERLDFRLKSFNYNTYQIINKEQKPGEKWVALVGNAHIKKGNNIPGIADLINARSITIEDTDTKTKTHNEVTFQQPLQTLIGSNITVDARIIYDPTNDVPLITDIPKSMTQTQAKHVINKYNDYKGRFFGGKFIKTTEETKKAVNDLQIAKDDSERFSVALDYIKKNPDQVLANEIREELWPRRKFA